MTEAVNFDVNRYPELYRTWQYSPFTKQWSLSSETVRNAQRWIKYKQKSVTTPKYGSWRKPLPYSSHEYIFDRYFRGTIIISRGSGGYMSKFTGTGAPVTPPTLAVPSFPSSLIAQTEVRALNALKGDGVNIGVSLGERREVADMMISNFGKIARAYRAVRKGNLGDAASALGIKPRRYVPPKPRYRRGRRLPPRRPPVSAGEWGVGLSDEAANRWLEYQYGWKPLLSDVYEASRQILEGDKHHPQRVAYFVRETLNSEELVKYHYQSGNVWYKGTTTAKHSCTVRFDFWPDPDDIMFREFNELGIMNPLAVAWELIPFSFVVDWALPIGDFLNAIGASKGYDLKGGSCSRFTKVDSAIGLYGRPAAKLVACVGEAKGTGYRFQRTVYNTFPYPNLKYAFHAHHKKASEEAIATRTANALSILKNMFKG